jgi:hypothetical protein
MVNPNQSSVSSTIVVGVRYCDQIESEGMPPHFPQYFFQTWSDFKNGYSMLLISHVGNESNIIIGVGSLFI